MSSIIPKSLDGRNISQIISRLAAKKPNDREIVAIFGELINKYGDYSLNIRPKFDNVRDIEIFIDAVEITVNINDVSGLRLRDLIKLYGQPQQPPLGTSGQRTVIFSQVRGENLCRLVVRIPLSVALTDAPVQDLGIQCTYNKK